MSKKVRNGKLEERVRKKKFPWWWILIILAVLIVSVLAIFMIYEMKEESILREEVEVYLKKDLATAEFDTDNIKTKGDYAILEKEIKKYFKDVSDTVQKITDLEEDDTFTNILTPANFQEDGPEFEKSFQKITEIKEQVESSISDLTKLCSKEYIDSLLDTYSLDSYYTDLYQELMYSEDDLKDLTEIQNQMTSVGDFLKNFLQDCENILTFLKENSKRWMIENNELVFYTDELLKEYQDLTKKLVEDSNF